MFEVGKRYEIKMLEAGSEITLSGVVERYEHPLLKLRDMPPANMDIRDIRKNQKIDEQVVRGPIINVGSSVFVSAVLDDR